VVVVLDCAPVVEVDDAVVDCLVLGDGAFCARTGCTRARNVKRAAATARAPRKQIRGAVAVIFIEQMYAIIQDI
jgi:hypothetical protein